MDKNCKTYFFFINYTNRKNNYQKHQVIENNKKLKKKIIFGKLTMSVEKIQKIFLIEIMNTSPTASNPNLKSLIKFFYKKL